MPMVRRTLATMLLLVVAALALGAAPASADDAGDEAGFLALLAEDVVHDTNQGAREVGREPFRASCPG